MPKKITASEKSKELCADCSLCCEYVNILIKKPKTKEAIDKIVWYLLHGVEIHIDADGDWTVYLPLKCRALTEEKICGIYPTRPNICKQFSQSDCERYNHDSADDIVFANEKEFLAYVNSNLPLKAIYTGNTDKK